MSSSKRLCSMDAHLRDASIIRRKPTSAGYTSPKSMPQMAWCKGQGGSRARPCFREFQPFGMRHRGPLGVETRALCLRII